MKKPLVMMIGIGTYPNGGVLGDLIGVPTDYKNMIKLFALHWGYPFVYQTNDNKIEYLDKQKLQKKKNTYKKNFKLKWNGDEIGGFVLKSKKIIERIKPDGLIFLISSHGDRENVLIDSEFEEIPIAFIMAEYWNTNGGCPYLANKPKLFFLDMCQGPKLPLPKGLLKKHKKIKISTKGPNDTENSYKDKEKDKDKKNENHKNSSNNNNNDQHETSNDETKNSDKQENNEDNKENTMNWKDKEDKNYLEYENFCVIYGNLENYKVVDGGKFGGYLIRSLKSVLKQRDACNLELNQLIILLRNETLRLVKGEKKKSKQDFVASNCPTRQIIDYQSSVLGYVFFGKLAQHEYTFQSQFRYQKYLHLQQLQLKSSFKSPNSYNYIKYQSKSSNTKNPNAYVVYWYFGLACFCLCVWCV